MSCSDRPRWHGCAVKQKPFAFLLKSTLISRLEANNQSKVCSDWWCSKLTVIRKNMGMPWNKSLLLFYWYVKSFHLIICWQVFVLYFNPEHRNLWRAFPRNLRGVFIELKKPNQQSLMMKFTTCSQSSTAAVLNTRLDWGNHADW